MSKIRKDFLEDMISYCLKTAYHKMMEGAEDQLETFGLTVPQFSVLAVVSINPGVTQSRLVENLYVTRSTGSEVIEKLVRRELLDRQPIDRKSSGLILTMSGEKLFAEALKMANSMEKEFSSRLSKDEIKQLKTLLLKIADETT